ncbi:MAG: 16S rRNA (cytidine(1402)-2'-O)-methyltransferase [Acidobacteriota bacterium]
MPQPEPEPGVLWIVATPIGTLGDLSPRASEVLDKVGMVLAEDTRRARRLLSHIGVTARGRLRSLHEHNEQAKVDSLVSTLAVGTSIALVSDAGTPVLSDPGYLLVRAVRDAGLMVASVPGPSSFTAALAAAGQPPLPATLAGFLPAKQGPRRRRIAELATCPWTLVVLLSPHRIGRELEDLSQVLGGDREATLLAEVSKVHERAVVGPLAELAESAEAGHPRGEYILVVGPAGAHASETEIDAETIREVYHQAVAGGADRRQALRRTAQRLGLSRRVVFDVLAVPREGNAADRESGI